jgi:hypothetical protein
MPRKASRSSTSRSSVSRPSVSRPSVTRSLRQSRFRELAHPGRPAAMLPRRQRKSRRSGPRSQSGRRSGTAVRHRQARRGPIARAADANEPAPELTAPSARSGISPPEPRAQADSRRRAAPTPHRWSTHRRLTHRRLRHGPLRHRRLTHRLFHDAQGLATLRRATDRSCPAGYRPRRQLPTDRRRLRRRPARFTHPMSARRFRSGWRRRQQRRPQTRRPRPGHRPAHHHPPCPSGTRPRHRRRHRRRQQDRRRPRARRRPLGRQLHQPQRGPQWPRRGQRTRPARECRPRQADREADGQARLVRVLPGQAARSQVRRADARWQHAWSRRPLWS